MSAASDSFLPPVPDRSEAEARIEQALKVARAAVALPLTEPGLMFNEYERRGIAYASALARIVSILDTGKKEF